MLIRSQGTRSFLAGLAPALLMLLVQPGWPLAPGRCYAAWPHDDNRMVEQVRPDRPIVYVNVDGDSTTGKPRLRLAKRRQTGEWENGPISMASTGFGAVARGRHLHATGPRHPASSLQHCVALCKLQL